VILLALILGLTLMLLKDVGVLHTGHALSVFIAVICIVLAIVGLFVYEVPRWQERRARQQARSRPRAS
jgi:hypothetical protein